MKAQTEFTFLNEDAKSVQKKLNQWRHAYHIKLHGLTFEGTSIKVMVERNKIDPRATVVPQFF
ncbi:hypothetical protein [Endozoicomonas sp. SESOKO1]|uniref:hypothetical protein n=1 Tax=Endozoicomonas sp. SESOKO1 TaxID=2828742 RepID=UPI0021488B11|nr:hypothetical protein [Endozoicomonas sp. SESOKO1]